MYPVFDITPKEVLWFSKIRQVVETGDVFQKKK
jgi:hypothetical protein